MGSDDQLGSFIAYSMIIYPITNYIVSPSRKYSRNRAIFYVVTFLLIVAAMQWKIETIDGELNYYSQLHVNRASTTSEIKRAYLKLSLHLHPDKNKDPKAVEIFHSITHAKEVLLNNELRSVYDRYGKAGEQMIQRPDQYNLQHLITQILMNFGFSFLFTIFLTFSEPTSHAFHVGIFCLTELCMAVEYSDMLSLPSWFLPQLTVHELLQICKRSYVLFLNGTKIVCSTYFIPIKKQKQISIMKLIQLYHNMKIHLVQLINYYDHAKRKQLKHKRLNENQNDMTTSTDKRVGVTDGGVNVTDGGVTDGRGMKGGIRGVARMETRRCESGQEHGPGYACGEGGEGGSDGLIDVHIERYKLTQTVNSVPAFGGYTIPTPIPGEGAMSMLSGGTSSLSSSGGSEIKSTSDESKYKNIGKKNKQESSFWTWGIYLVLYLIARFMLSMFKAHQIPLK